MTQLHSDCYEVLQLERETATAADIKKAYRKLALLYHPDKLGHASEEEKAKANEQFQQIGFAYTILSDPKRKERYDKTGSTDESFFESEKNWTDYFKELWTGIVSADTIEEFKAKYQGSDEERQDVFKAYNSQDGNMTSILTMIECSEAKDGERFQKMIEEGIKNKELTLLKHFKSTTTKEAHSKRIKAEANEAKKALKEQEEQNKKSKKNKKKQKKDDEDNNVGSMDSLALLIQQRNRDRASKMNDMFESLEKRALREQEDEEDEEEGEGGGNSGLPTDEEFNRIQEALMNNKRKRNSTDLLDKEEKKTQKRRKAHNKK